MPPIDRPPVSPQAQAQMGPPGGPGFGSGIGQAMQQQDKSPVEVAVSTVEKILTGVQNDAFRPYVEKAMATLKVGMAMAAKQGPQSSPMGMPPGGPGGAGGPAPTPLPPTPGQIPG